MAYIIEKILYKLVSQDLKEISYDVFEAVLNLACAGGIHPFVKDMKSIKKSYHERKSGIWKKTDVNGETKAYNF